MLMRYALLVVLFAGPAAADIGAATAVVPDAKGTPPGGAASELKVGSRIVANERITAGPSGKVQLMFTDGTTLNVGSGSDLVLDKYVFDPRRGTGDMSATMGKGVLRFVGGRVSKRRKAKVKTPVGTVGIRGGIATIAYEPGGELTAVFLFGEEMSVTAGGVTRTARRPGQAIRVPLGAPPTQPAKVEFETWRKIEGRIRAPRKAGISGPPVPGVEALNRRVANFGVKAQQLAPLPGRAAPGAPAKPGSPKPGVVGPLAQPTPGLRPPGGPGAPPIGSGPELPGPP